MRTVPLLSPTDNYTADQQVAIGTIITEYNGFVMTVISSLPGIALAGSNETIATKFVADPASQVYFNAITDISNLCASYQQNTTGLYTFLDDPNAFLTISYDYCVQMMNISAIILAY